MVIRSYLDTRASKSVHVCTCKEEQQGDLAVGPSTPERPSSQAASLVLLRLYVSRPRALPTSHTTMDSTHTYAHTHTTQSSHHSGREFGGVNGPE